MKWKRVRKPETAGPRRSELFTALIRGVNEIGKACMKPKFVIRHSPFVISSRHRQFIKNLLDDCFAGFFLGLRFVGDGDAVAQHIHADAFDVLRRDIAAAPQKRIGFGREGQGNRRARRGAELDEIL